ncbi:MULTISPECIES: hypothetical protein [Pseudomonas syringae group]|uniref:hypothetical protein n=1 Tax=Pseudomonas syringae group TaxID=136849 RepID=UPI0006B50FB9|nr:MULTISPECIES: hypothetical protein [Pseudomonas syringae group]KPY04515.1 hypothetical protein ALO57_200179 [Pseudomonas coronafaciens pv. oryzae]MBD8806985.1 hypothetical protein [Pseudomonas syringae]RMT03929.1 hypothetical protein ALP55_02909 [Pseudomonas coronafaciens pv. oryzae]
MSEQTSWVNDAFSVGSVIATVVTAFATILLWRVTKLLAKETTRMVEASDQPHVVATLTPNRWSLRHYDLAVDNTGNATAYDIRIDFNPPLENGEARQKDAKIPFDQVSVLKPGQGLRSYLADINILRGKSYEVKISWRRGGTAKPRETNVYTLNMADFAGTSELGKDPAIDIARSLEKIEKSLSKLGGAQHLNVDVHTALDREKERQLLLAEFDSIKARLGQTMHKENDESGDSESTS